MRVQLECYGLLTELCGSDIALDLPGPEARIDDVLQQLARQWPEVEPHLAQLAVARGDTLVKRDALVKDGESLALLPPVSGG